MGMKNWPTGGNAQIKQVINQVCIINSVNVYDHVLCCLFKIKYRSQRCCIERIVICIQLQHLIPQAYETLQRGSSSLQHHCDRT